MIVCCIFFPIDCFLFGQSNKCLSAFILSPLCLFLRPTSNGLSACLWRFLLVHVKQTVANMNKIFWSLCSYISNDLISLTWNDNLSGICCASGLLNTPRLECGFWQNDLSRSIFVWMKCLNLVITSFGRACSSYNFCKKRKEKADGTQIKATDQIKRKPVAFI